MSHVEILDFDPLVRKHVRIVPTYRCLQISSWVLLTFALILPVAVALFVIFDFLEFGGKILAATEERPILDFQHSRTFIHQDLFDKLVLSFWSLTGVAFAWPLAVFVTLSLISFQLDRFTLVALTVVVLWQTAIHVTTLVNDSLKWHGAFDASLGSIVTDLWVTGVFAYLDAVILLTVFQMYAMSANERSILREGGTDARFSGSTFLARVRHPAEHQERRETGPNCAVGFFSAI